MRVKRETGAIVIAFNALEGRFIAQILARIADTYRTKPDHLAGQAGDLLYTAKGCAEGTSPEEVRDWRDQLHGLKLARLTLIEDWLARLNDGGVLRTRLTVKPGDAHDFVGTINDHRLLTAAEHGIGEEEMTLRNPDQMDALPPARQSALLEIHFLAWIIEEVLGAMESS